jgi:hypothetical protein
MSPPFCIRFTGNHREYNHFAPVLQVLSLAGSARGVYQGWLGSFFEIIEKVSALIKAFFTVVLEKFDDKKDSGKKVSANFKQVIAMYNSRDGQRGAMYARNAYGKH